MRTLELRRKFHVGILTALIGFSNCSYKKIDNLVFTGDLDGKRVEVRYVNSTFLYEISNHVTRETKISVFGKDESLEKVFCDAGSGKLGDENRDYVEVHLGGGKVVTYNPGSYINESGQIVSFSEDSDIVRELKSLTEKKFQEYDLVYQGLKKRTLDELSKKL